MACVIRTFRQRSFKQKFVFCWKLINLKAVGNGVAVSYALDLRQSLKVDTTSYLY